MHTHTHSKQKQKFPTNKQITFICQLFLSLIFKVYVFMFVTWNALWFRILNEMPLLLYTLFGVFIVKMPICTMCSELLKDFIV